MRSHFPRWFTIVFNSTTCRGTCIRLTFELLLSERPLHMSSDDRRLLKSLNRPVRCDCRLKDPAFEDLFRSYFVAALRNRGADLLALES